MTTDKSVTRALLHSPLPLIVAGIGLTLFLTTRKNPLITRRDLHTIAKKLDRTARKASRRADRQYLADRGETLLDKASDALSDYGHRVRRYGDDGLSRMKSQLSKDRSMALSALGIGLGVLASALGARTRRHWH